MSNCPLPDVTRRQRDAFFTARKFAQQPKREPKAKHGSGWTSAEWAIVRREVEKIRRRN